MATRIRFGHIVGAGLLALLAGCPFFDGDDDDAAADPLTTQVVGATGGRITSPDGSLSLDVPAGALAADTAITVVEVSAANQSELVRAQKPTRVYRLEPSGLTFAQPVTATIDLPPSADGHLAFAVLYSGDKFQPLQALTLAFGASQLRMTAQLDHFSELLVLEEQGTTAVATVAPRAIKVGETLDATLSVSKGASGAEVTIEAEIDYISTSNPADLVFVAENLTDFYTVVPPVKLPAGANASAASLQTWSCVREHTGVMRFYIGLSFPFLIVDIDGKVIDTTTMTVSRLEPAEIDYVCDAAPPPPDELRTGLFTLPFGMTSPDGMHIIDGAFSNLGGNGPYLSIAGNNGALIMDLRTGLSALNMTPGGPDGRLGNGALLGALPVSLAGPGPATVAGLFATGAGGAVRSYTPDGKGGFVWGATLLTLRPVLDAATAGGDYVSDEVFTVEPLGGINTWSVRSDFWQYDATIPGSAYTGSLVSAAVPFTDGGRVLALTDDGTTSRLWDFFRFQPGAVPTEIADLGGTGARQLRCLPESATPAPLAGSALCGATLSRGEMHLFVIRPDFPAVAPAVTVLPVGTGALGLALGQRASGFPVAVVANFEGQSLNVVDFDADGVVINNRTVAVPEGCLSPPHAAPVSAGGKDYIAGTCNGSGHYFVIEMPPR